MIGGVGVYSLTSTQVKVIEVPVDVPIKEATANPAAVQQSVPEVERSIVAPKQKYRNANDVEQVLIEYSAFHMGCTTEFSGECLADEFPSHSVQISKSYYIMQHEVTQDLYTKVMAINPSQFRVCGSDCPVENISWVQINNSTNHKLD